MKNYLTLAFIKSLFKRAYKDVRDFVFEFFSGGRGLEIQLVFNRPGNGKSLNAARLLFALFDEYRATRMKYPELKKRAVWSNMKFSKEIEKEHLGKDLFYFTHPSELYNLRDVDIIFDDIGLYVPVDAWNDIPKKLRKLFIMYRHRGLSIFANAQDYKMVAVQFRRMIKHAYSVQKIIGSRDKSVTMPPIRFVWGFILRREYNPEQLEAQGKTVADLKDQKLKSNWLTGWKIFCINKKLIDAYDTTEELDPEDSLRYEHETWKCENKDCDYEKSYHTKKL